MRLTIAGLCNSERVRAASGNAVLLAGRVPDLKPLYEKAKLLIAPTRYAAGIPHKVHEAAAHGLPVVATRLIADQLGWSARELAIGETAADLAVRCVEVYTNASTWTGLRDAALSRVESECSPQVFEEKVARILTAGKAAPTPAR